MTVTTLIPLKLSFNNSRSEHHKNLMLIVPETPRPGRTGRPKPPQGLSVTRVPQGHAFTRVALDVTELAATPIPPEQLREAAAEIQLQVVAAT